MAGRQYAHKFVDSKAPACVNQLICIKNFNVTCHAFRPECMSRPAQSSISRVPLCTAQRRVPKLCAYKQDGRDRAIQTSESFSTEKLASSPEVSISPGPLPTEDSTHDNGAASPHSNTKKARNLRKKRNARDSDGTATMETPLLVVTKPLPRVLILHTGGTLGMDPEASFQASEKGVNLKKGTGGVYAGG
jgi:hypothetical protein